MSKELSIDDIRERIIFTEKVAHVTFYVVKETVVEDYNAEGAVTKDEYRVYSESEKLGLHPVDGFEYQQLNPGSYDDAQTVLRMEIQRLEEILERKRDGVPTQKQVHFLFSNKIPIPIDLTWGQAFDLIDEHLARIAKDKQTRRLERFNGLTEGDKVSWTRGKGTMTGHITKLYQAGSAGKFALVEAEDGNTYRTQKFDKLQKIDGEA